MHTKEGISTESQENVPQISKRRNSTETQENDPNRKRFKKVKLLKPRQINLSQKRGETVLLLNDCSCNEVTNENLIYEQIKKRELRSNRYRIY